jgi:hypothetical protein
MLGDGQGRPVPHDFQLAAAAAPFGTLAAAVGLPLAFMQCAAKAPHQGVATEVGLGRKSVASK